MCVSRRSSTEFCYNVARLGRTGLHMRLTYRAKVIRFRSIDIPAYPERTGDL